MATSSEDGVSAAAYGGVGAGGKFRKKPFRRAHLPTTPYDRPLTARISNPNNGSSNNPGLFAKLVVEPASKLISYGAHRLFSSVFRKRLPPPPPQAPEVNCRLSDKLQVAVSVAVSDCDVLKSGGGTSDLLLCSSADDGISELEQLLKQKTFSRSEIDHLTGLLQSRAAVEFSPCVGPKRSGGAPNFERHQPFASSPSEEHMQDGDRSLRVVSSPIINSRVIEDDMAPPAELAKAYMGSRPYKISPSKLGTRDQVCRENAGLLSNVPFASKSSNMSLNMTTSVGRGDPKNGFITPKSRGRSAIYNMARTPYSRVHPISIKKEIESTNNFDGELSIPSSSSSVVKQNEKIEAKTMTLKRRSSVLDDDTGSVGPMRRLRQKPNLLASKIPVIAHGAESGSDLALVSSKQKLPLVVEQKNRVSKFSGQDEEDSISSASYACVSSKSTEVAARILQHLEKLTPKEKSSESKLTTVREKSTFRLTPSMLRGQALRSMEDVDSSKLLLAVQEDHRLGDRSDVALSHDRDSTFERPGKVENGDKQTAIVSATLNSAVENEFLESSSILGPSRTADDPAVKNSVAERPQTKRAFRMSAQEDFSELDDDEHCYGIATRPLVEGRGQPDAHTLGNKRSDNEEPKLVKTNSQPEVKLPVVLSKTTECSNPRAPMIETGNDGISPSSSERENVAIQSDVLSQSVISFEKANGTNDSVPSFRLASQTVDNAPPLPSVSVNVKPESKSENSISLLEPVSTANGSKMETPESDQGLDLNPLKTRDANGKPHTAPFASNGPLISRAPTVSFTTSHDANQILTAISSPLTSSTSMASFSWIGTSTNATSSTSIASFGLTGFSNSNTTNDNSFRSNAAVSVFKFGASVDPSSALLAPPTTNISEVSELKERAEKEPNPYSSSGIHSAVTPLVATNSGSRPLGPSTSISNSSANNFQGSLPATANKSSVSDFGLVSKSASIPISSSLSLPSLNMNGSISLSTSLSHPQFNQNQSLGFSTSASSSETSMVKSVGGPTSSVSKFGASSTLLGDSAVSLNVPATPGIFGFGLSSSNSVSAVGSTNGVTPPVVNYGGSSMATSVTNNASSSSIGTSGIFNFAASSSASTSAASNIFGSTWESPKPLAFSSTFTTSSPSSVFSFGALASTTTPANATPTVFSSQSGPSSSPIFPFSASSPAFSLPSVSLNQSIFGNRPPSFTASPSSGDQMNAEDSMAEDPVQSSAPSIPIFGQPTISPSPTGFTFGSTAPPLSNPFQFSGQQNQIAPLNPSPFQAAGSLEFNNGGSFSLGSGGADKSNRKFVKVNRNKNRKK